MSLASSSDGIPPMGCSTAKVLSKVFDNSMQGWQYLSTGCSPNSRLPGGQATGGIQHRPWLTVGQAFAAGQRCVHG